ncbi:MAG TPA: hypothetical protein DHV15_07315 [Treponema sp.]|uniref:Uncharacterized protein n=1 Tax=Treponema denticola (strain ATCC 35405 / DSM 14222 / CIP 103919 / JCM 8153 / KCTC 15104) TaxID=243275 RepID=Q73K82_TREDE|nr:hypothetical protein TDE_2338 [Treponema denticola ATCC 35405]HCY95305.1 hypothetical protein [Treponema sp.]
MGNVHPESDFHLIENIVKTTGLSREEIEKIN